MSDKFISIFVVPIGLLICFGPALVVWLLAELKGSDKSERNETK